VGVELAQWLLSSHNCTCAMADQLKLFVLYSTCDLAIAARSEWWVWHMKSFALGTSTCSCLSVARQWDLSWSLSCYIKSVLRDAPWSRVPHYQTIWTSCNRVTHSCRCAHPPLGHMLYRDERQIQYSGVMYVSPREQCVFTQLFRPTSQRNSYKNEAAFL
jgi:hypothetical protein